MKFTWKTVLLPLLGIVGFFLYLYLFNVDVVGIIATAQRANPLIYSVAVICGFIEIFFFTSSWHALTSHYKHQTFDKESVLYVWYGIYVDTIVPAESIRVK